MDIHDRRLATKLLGSLVIVVIVILGLGFANSAYTGFAIYEKAVQSNQSVDDYLSGVDFLKSELGGLGIDIKSCNDLSNALLEKYEDKSKSLAACISDKEELRENKSTELNKRDEQIKQLNDTKNSEISSLNSQMSDLQKTLTEKTDDYGKLSEDYGNLVNNTAMSICCKAKIDDPLLKYYKVEDDKIVCSHYSGTPLNCPF